MVPRVNEPRELPTSRVKEVPSSMVGMIGWALLRLFRVPRGWGLWLVLAVMWSYAMVTGLRPPAMRAAIMASVFLLGFVLDFIEITFVIVPIIGPVLLSMGLDPVWLGVMIAINLQTSFLTPPFGFSLFYLRGVAPASVTTGHIYRGVVPFIVIQLLALVALSIWPALATWLPQAIYG